MELFLRPLYFCSLALLPTLILLLLFPARIFKYWLYFIFPWSLLLAIYAVSQTDPHQMSILSLPPFMVGVIVWGLVYYLTVAYIFGMYMFAYWKKRIDKKALLPLLLLIPAMFMRYYFMMLN